MDTDAAVKDAPCPCGSGNPYRGCCAAVHDGREPTDPVSVVRARFSAFVLGRYEYLWRSLHPAHFALRRDEASFTHELRAARETWRYQSLVVHGARVAAGRAQVLITVKAVRGEEDRSFVELATLESVEQAWRYRFGITRPERELPAPTFENVLG